MPTVNSSNSRKYSMKEQEADTKRKKVRPKKLKFEDAHTRVTTYLKNSLFEEIQELRDLGHIATITGLYNEAIDDYLEENYR